ncbi:carboxylesterase family protein [Aureispira sp. CCB-QB1]|uniref:carboxylesterase family protein n=1 Tax=Aureispira sp. CCB-QB1 TaxID=1313421 RepID=UPI000697C97F|nr:carboxylesterase family protein [Aureispira sp. CCB-QB1]
MLRIVLLLLVLSSCGMDLFAQCGTRYKSRYFNTIQVFRNVKYSLNAPALIGATLTTETTFNKDLVMDVFTPPVTDTVSKRPVVILAHGGGFINVAFMGGTVLVGTMQNEDVQALADTLAHWGFVTASIEYRLGFNIASPSSLKRAVWRGAQDMSAAVRFFRKNAAWFNIDPNKVFVGGSSAGAFCAIHSTFVDYTERLPESYELVPIFKKDLGPLHSRPVVELTSFNPFNGSSVLADDVDSIPQGIAAYWGAIADLSWMAHGNNKAPMVMFHGTNDLIVDYKCAKPFSGVVLTAPNTCGTYMMDSVMNTFNLPHQTYFAQGEGHEYWGALNGDWLPSGPNAHWQSIIDKTADYFYDLMRPTPPVLSGPDTVLPATNYTYTVANPHPDHRYCWEVTGGVIVSPVTDAATIDVEFYNGGSQGFVQVSAIDVSKVASEKALKFSAITTSINTNKVLVPKLGIQLQPNPAYQSCRVHIRSPKNEAATIRLVNALGQEVYTHFTPLSIGNTTEVLNIQDLPQGVYRVVVTTKKHRIMETLVIR